MKSYFVVLVILCILIAGIAIAEEIAVEDESFHAINSYGEDKNNNSFQKLDNQIRKTWY